MYGHEVYDSNGGLSPKIGLSTWTKLDGYSYEQELSRYMQVYFHTVMYVAVVYMKSTNSYVQKYLPLQLIVSAVAYMYITLFTNTLTLVSAC